MTEHPREGRLQWRPMLLCVGPLLLTWKGIRAPLLGVASFYQRQRVLDPHCPAHPRCPAAVHQVSRPA